MHQNQNTKRQFMFLENIREPIVLPIPAITEVAYLLARDVSNEAAADFIASLAATELTLEIPRQGDHSRSAEILRQYFRCQARFCRHYDRRYSGTAEHHTRSHT